MNNPETAIVITTEINKRRQYVKRFVAQRETGLLIPIYTTDPGMAKDFSNLEHAFNTVDLIVPPGMRNFIVGSLEHATGMFFPALPSLNNSLLQQHKIRI